MTNYMQPQPYEILSVKHETDIEYTFRIATDIKPEHGQFLQLSIPKIGECPISVSEQGEGWLEFTIRKVGKVTDVIFQKKAGDCLFLRGPYGKGWPMDQIKGKHLFVVAGGTGVSPVRSLLNYCVKNEGFVKSVSLICGFKSYDSVLFRNDLEKWNEKFNTWFCLDNEEHEGFNKGFVTAYVDQLPLAAVKEAGEDYAVVVVGPPPMMKFTGIELLKNGFEEEKIWMSFERKMSCAIGKCGHCRIDEVYVCLDGPCFPYTVAKDLVD
ncbi:MAG: anaerobic sulfite reductase subunit AsrB [Firmicutes bacterium]|nr:anaerobic sulfite reductase subunit AsrB [Bacillota bacterium]